jgi:TIR domain-containing protein
VNGLLSPTDAFVDQLVRLLHDLLPLLRNASHGVEDAGFFSTLFQLARRLIKSVALPEVLLAFCIALGASLVVVCLFVGADVLVTAIRRGRARVFVSYQHDQDSIVGDIVRQMTNAGLRVERLPYVDAPDHDALLDEIKRQIQRCEVFLCVPGPNPSFVDNEVSMAFALERPLLFVAADPNSPKIPNTAKIGYPVFDLKRLNAAGIQTLAAFCSYVAGDWRSKLRIYGTLVRYYRQCLAGLGVLYVLVIIAMTRLPTHSNHPHARSLSDWLSWFFSSREALILFGISLAYLAIPYAIFCFIRFAFQRRLRVALSHQTFENGLLPYVQDTSLEGQDIVSILCRAKPVAYHELATSTPSSPRSSP